MTLTCYIICSKLHIVKTKFDLRTTQIEHCRRQYLYHCGQIKFITITQLLTNCMTTIDYTRIPWRLRLAQNQTQTRSRYLFHSPFVDFLSADSVKMKTVYVNPECKMNGFKMMFRFLPAFMLVMSVKWERHQLDIHVQNDATLYVQNLTLKMNVKMQKHFNISPTTPFSIWYYVISRKCKIT